MPIDVNLLEAAFRRIPQRIITGGSILSADEANFYNFAQASMEEVLKLLKDDEQKKSNRELIEKLRKEGRWLG